MVQHLKSLEQVHLENSWLTIGSFDGVHLGHQEIIRGITAGAHAEGAPAVVLTFYPHPAAVLHRRSGSFCLSLPDERAGLIGEIGADYVITHPFNTQVAATSARNFISGLHQHLGFRQLWVGYDFALGHSREGDVNTLRQLGEVFHYGVHLVPPVTFEGETVSSSRIRMLLTDGRIELANRLLGRPYRLSGVVIPGDGRGHSIGFPTANLSTGDEKLIPGNGVYACRAVVGGQLKAAAVNIGLRPTFDGLSQKRHVEAHILEYKDNLYGQTITLEFLQLLRTEQRFTSIQALIEQIHKDIQHTREIIGVGERT